MFEFYAENEKISQKNFSKKFLKKISKNETLHEFPKYGSVFSVNVHIF